MRVFFRQDEIPPHDFTGAKCVGLSWLFDSTDRRDHAEAKRLCGECPAMTECAVYLNEVLSVTTAQKGGCPAGTWAGRLLGERTGLSAVRRARTSGRLALSQIPASVWDNRDEPDRGAQTPQPGSDRTALTERGSAGA